MDKIKTCKILGVNINVITMEETLQLIANHLEELRGEYICVSNVHTTVMSSEDAAYCNVQNGAFLRLPDGKPLSIVAAQRGFAEAVRVTGPDLMQRTFEEAEQNGYRHFFYGSSEETLRLLREKLLEKYPAIQIAGMYSPPFGAVSEEEDAKHIAMINESRPDIVWIGLGAPKQENWMFAHKGRINGLMVGVGAGFDYHAGNIRRAPGWMQKMCLEWLYRLLQDPKRLFKRYFDTNTKFLKRVKAENKKIDAEKRNGHTIE